LSVGGHAGTFEDLGTSVALMQASIPLGMEAAHDTAVSGLFQQVLALTQQAGLATLKHVDLDGTKVRANASKHKAVNELSKWGRFEH
jgi:hypothetical protein